MQRINCRSENSKGVYCLQYDDNKIVSGLRDNTIKIWDRHTLQCNKVSSIFFPLLLSLITDNCEVSDSHRAHGVRIVPAIRRQSHHQRLQRLNSSRLGCENGRNDKHTDSSLRSCLTFAIQQRNDGDMLKGKLSRNQPSCHVHSSTFLSMLGSFDCCVGYDIAEGNNIT